MRGRAYILLLSTLLHVSVVARPGGIDPDCLDGYDAAGPETGEVALGFTPELPKRNFADDDALKEWAAEAVDARFGESSSFIGSGFDKLVYDVMHEGHRVALMIPKLGKEKELETEVGILEKAQEADPVGSQYLLPKPKRITITHDGHTVEGLLVFRASEKSVANNLPYLGPKTDAQTMLSMWKQMAMGLRAIHASGNAHHDVKSGNFFLHLPGDATMAFLGDLGAAKPLGVPVTAVKGTPGFMSLGHLRGDPPAVAHDLFALRNTMMEMVLGKSLARAIKEGDVPRGGFVKIGKFYIHVNSIPEAVRKQMDPALVEVMDAFTVDANGDVNYKTVDQLIESLNAAILKVESRKI